MYQKQEFIDGVTTLKAEHLQHIEEGISNALSPESQDWVTISNIIPDSYTFWVPGFIQNPNPATQQYTDQLYTTPVGNPAKTVKYATSPLFKLRHPVKIKLNNGAFIRQLNIYTRNKEIVANIGTDGDAILGGNAGLSTAKITEFKNNEENKQLYPNLYDALTTTSLVLNYQVIKEISDMFAAINSKYHSCTPDDEIYYSFNITTTTLPPTNEAENLQWCIDAANRAEILETITTKAFELPGLRFSDDVLTSYKSPLIEDVALEIAENQTILGMQDINTQITTNTTVYSQATTSNFYPSAYTGLYISNSNFQISDFNTPTYSAGTTAYEGYAISIPMPLEFSSDVEYKKQGNMRHYAFLNSSGKTVYYGSVMHSGELILDKDYFDSIGVDINQVKYLCISNSGSAQSTFKLTKTATIKESTYTLPNLILTENQLAGGGGTSTGASNVIDLFNVDRIVAIGDSYTESHYTVKDKSWISKVSLLSDYNVDNFALSGDTYRGQLNKIRTGSYAYAKTSGITWESLHPTHALMICKTNDTKYMNCQQFIYDMMATVDVTKGLGAIPIIATEYHVSGHDFVQTAFDYCAKQSGGYYVDLTEKAYALRGADYAPFWGGSHPGTRSNHLFSDVITKFVNEQMPRPYAAIKIFRPRVLSDNFDDYLFSDIKQRAEKFKEISICHSALTDPSLVDQCTNQKNAKIESEYFKLMAGQLLTFDKVCLIDAILPTTVHDVSEVTLNVTVPTGVQCFVKDALAEPYPSPAFCRRFDIPEILTDEQVVVGNTYTSNKSTGATYKVVEILYDQVESDSGFVNGTILICSGNKGTSAYNDSILTLTSGTGSSTLNCSYEAVGLSSDYPAGKQDIGHYVNTSKFGVLSGSLLKRAMDNDKVTFLLIHDSTFTISNLSISFKGNITKQRDSIHYDKPYNDIHTEQSVLSTKLFDSTNISKWLNNTTLQACNLTPIKPLDNCLPSGVSQIITLMPNDTTIVQKLNTVTPTSGTTNSVKKVKVWARYFPDVFDATTMTYPDQAAITEESFDWAKLNIQLYSSNTQVKNNDCVKMEHLVGLHWTEIEQDLILPPKTFDWYIGLSVVDKPIQIAYIDVV